MSMPHHLCLHELLYIRFMTVDTQRQKDLAVSGFTDKMYSTTES